ncbi:LysE family translocator [Azohydromonas caseinilytica]|uniref:LysE family translocator n=1 Tax=Azohydromonas caseinilytica TaxID=2728836 RepID=A0A848F844_9BURK|nr:LysE family translocator [Azohydromonas caseinilytica]NML14211.1 LysE family translocator [Azohydromonas caseinilytica]
MGEGIQWGLFLAACLALACTPGPDMIYVVSRALAQGRKAALISAAGLSLGLAAHTLFAAFGVSVLLQSSELAFTALKVAGACYLLWMGIQMWRAAPRIDIHAAGDRLDPKALFLQGSLSALLNPKLALFFLAFLPQFVPAESASAALDTVLLGLAFSVIGIGVQGIAGWVAGSLTQALRRNERAVCSAFRFSGALMLILGLRLLVAPR